MKLVRYATYRRVKEELELEQYQSFDLRWELKLLRGEQVNGRTRVHTCTLA